MDNYDDIEAAIPISKVNIVKPTEYQNGDDDSPDDKQLMPPPSTPVKTNITDPFPANEESKNSSIFQCVSGIFEFH